MWLCVNTRFTLVIIVTHWGHVVQILETHVQSFSQKLYMFNTIPHSFYELFHWNNSTFLYNIPKIILAHENTNSFFERFFPPEKGGDEQVLIPWEILKEWILQRKT